MRVASARRKCVAPGLIVQISESPYRGPFRVGFTASRKVGPAVARNRARRRLRRVAELIMPDLATPGYDYVIIARKSTPMRPFGALKEDLAQALRRLEPTPVPRENEKESAR